MPQPPQTELIDAAPEDDLESYVGATLACLRALRTNPTASEYEIHRLIKEVLRANNQAFEHEVVLSKGCRIDFVVCGVIGVEVKRGKPNSQKVLAQLMRYADHSCLSAIILVVERNIWTLPRTVRGKPVFLLSLNANWGVAS